MTHKRSWKRYKLGYSISRMKLDDYLFQYQSLISGNVLDIGGTKNAKAGYFDIDRVSNKVSYLNIDPNTKPDYLCSAENIPIRENKFDTVILCEVLEHLENPVSAVHEAFRVLKPDGNIIITMPFLFKLHAEPNDYQRWTEYKLKKTLMEAGFSNIEIKRLGGFWSVLADLIKIKISAIKWRWLALFLGALFVPMQYFFIEVLEKFLSSYHSKEWPLHYGLTAKK